MPSVFSRRAEARAFRRDLLDGCDNFFVSMAQDHRTPGTDVVNVGFAVNVGNRRAARGLYKARRAANAAKSAVGRINTAGYEILRRCE